MTQSNDAETIRELQARLSESEQRFEGAFGTAAHGMALVSTEGRWLQVNQALCDLVGYSEKELLTTDFQTITHPDDLETDLGYVNQLLNNDIHSYQMEKRYFHKSGRVIWILLSVSLVRDQFHQPKYFVSQIIDITDTKRALLHAQKATQAAERASKAKSDFLARVSHELRTPLNSILGFSRILRRQLDGRLTEREHDALNTIFQNGESLLGLINDVLDLSKIESGNTDLKITTFAVADTLENVASRMKSLADEKGLDIILHLPDTPMLINTDRQKLEQILLNLISNAIKYTKEGTVKIGASKEQTESGFLSVVFEVTDTGIGMAAEDLQSLFQEFNRARQVEQMNIGGTGLGLSICKRFADILRGRIEVQSEPGVGSSFRLRLPVHESDPALSLCSNPTESSGYNNGIICLSDDIDCLDRLYNELSRIGIYPTRLTDMAEVAAYCNSKIPDIIILDYNDNSAQCRKALQQLRSVERLINCRIAVCCSSQIAFERFHELGADNILNIPFNAVSLSQFLKLVNMTSD